MIRGLFRCLLWILQKVGHLIGYIIGFVFGWIPRLKKHMSGEEFEEYVYEILKRIGYKHIRLTQKSGDYGVDILATYKGIHYAFQCKYYSKPVGVLSLIHILSLSNPMRDCHVCIMVRLVIR